MSPERLAVLSIDDDVSWAKLLQRHLEKIPSFIIEFLHATTAEDARRILGERAVDLLFLDHQLGTGTGLALLKQLRAAGYIQPVIALTCHGNEYVARDLMRQGADDYLAKREVKPELLRRTIDAATSRFHRRRLETLNRQLTQDLKCKNETLKQQNQRLTDLYRTAHEFVDNVSHEFRTPLTVIKEFTSIMNDGLVGEVSAEQQEYLRTVLDRVDDLSTMIDDMLDISKLEAGLLGSARRICSISDVVHRVRKTLERKAASNQVNLDLSAGESLPQVYCDPEKIGRVIINLTINAIKFSAEDGDVTIGFRFEPDQGMIRIGVTDQGPGIDPDKVAEIFDRFRQLDGATRSSTKGFGLGLNIARELVHLNLGDIEVASTLGAGSTFSFTVPTADPTRLIERYLERVESFRSGSSHVTLINVAIDDATHPAGPADVERFLQHQIRRSDLLFPAPPGHWLIVAASNQANLEHLTRRIEQAHHEANRNRPGAPLPPITLLIDGTWPLCAGRTGLQAAFQNALARQEAVHA